MDAVVAAASNPKPKPRKLTKLEQDISRTFLRLERLRFQYHLELAQHARLNEPDVNP